MNQGNSWASCFNQSKSRSREMPCLSFSRPLDISNAHLEGTDHLLADTICPVMLETIYCQRASQHLVTMVTKGVLKDHLRLLANMLGVYLASMLVADSLASYDLSLYDCIYFDSFNSLTQRTQSCVLSDSRGFS